MANALHHVRFGQIAVEGGSEHCAELPGCLTRTCTSFHVFSALPERSNLYIPIKPRWTAGIRFEVSPRIKSLKCSVDDMIPFFLWFAMGFERRYENPDM